jgi:hypothetical protein
MNLRKLLSIVVPAVAIVALTVVLAIRPRTPAVAEDVTIKPVAALPVAAEEPVVVALAQEEKKEEPRKTELPAGTGILKGKITLKGAVPELPPLVKKGDPSAKDAAVCAAMNVEDQALVVKDGAIQNVVIYLQKAPTGYKAPPPAAAPIVFDQKGCQFYPHVLAVRTGQTVTVKSGDPIAHNTHTSPFRSKEFNQAIGANDRVGATLVYDKPENVPVKVKCDLHPWMSAYHVVTDHPFAAVTDEKGEFEIVGVPAGKHEFTIWHEMPGYIERKKVVTIEAGKPTELNLEVDVAKLKKK